MQGLAIPQTYAAPTMMASQTYAAPRLAAYAAPQPVTYAAPAVVEALAGAYAAPAPTRYQPAPVAYARWQQPAPVAYAAPATPATTYAPAMTHAAPQYMAHAPHQMTYTAPQQMGYAPAAAGVATMADVSTASAGDAYAAHVIAEIEAARRTGKLLKELWPRLPGKLKDSASFRMQFVSDVELHFEAPDLFQVFPEEAKSDADLCKLFVDKCSVERRAGMWDDTIDGSFHAKLYRQFHKDVKNNHAVQNRVFEASSSHGMPMLFQFWPEEKQKDPAVQAQFLDKCNDATKLYLLKAFPSEVREDPNVLLSFIEKTGEIHLYKVYSGFPAAAKENLDLVYACIDRVATDFWLKCLFKAFPDEVRRTRAVREKCLAKCSDEAVRAELQLL